MATTQPEHLDVLIIGAGLSGVAAAHHLQAKTPWARVALLEARDAIGGTWDLFRYPGVRSDSDMFTLGYGFRPWQREEAIADGASIRAYIEEAAAAEGIDQRIRFGHRVESAAWSTDEARWHVTAERTDTGDVVELTCGFLFSCTGYYRYDHGYLPDFAGMDDFEGTIVHPQHWPEDLDVAGQRVVVIGSGATAVTLVPSLARVADHVTMLQRSPSYIAALPTRNPLAALVRRIVPARWADAAVRWALALMTLTSYTLSRRYPGAMRRVLRSGVERALPRGYDVDTHFTPSYDPWDQRLCLDPDGELFAAISDGRASVVTDHIDTFTTSGVRLRSGDELEADLIVTATGLEMLFMGGIDLTVDGEPVDPSSRLAYRGMMLQGVPNLAFAVGYTNASWTLKCELICDHVTRLLDHMHRTGRRQCTPGDPDPNVTTRPLLGLDAGYIRRAVDRFPKQGDTTPWQVHQNYVRDYREMRACDVDDGVMRFSDPAPSGQRPSGLVGAATTGNRS